MDSSTTEMSEYVFVNATPHPITLFDLADPNKILYEFPTTGLVIRVEDIVTRRALVNERTCRDYVMLTSLKPGDDAISIDRIEPRNSVTNPTELPVCESGKFYIVSRIVAEACRSRFDLVFPYNFVRNDKGAIIGCRGFARIER